MKNLILIVLLFTAMGCNREVARAILKDDSLVDNEPTTIPSAYHYPNKNVYNSSGEVIGQTR